MNKVSFYRAFHTALAVVCLLLCWPISVALERGEYYEDRYSAGNRYSKLLVVLRIFITLQSVFALLEVVFPAFFSQREREQIPDPELHLLLKHFVSKYFVSNLRMISVVCFYVFFGEWFGEDRDRVFKDGIALLFFFIVISISRFISQHQEFHPL